MKYMLLIMGNEKAMAAAPVDDTGMSPAYHAYNTAMAKAGVYVGGERLRPTDAATTVKVRDKKAVRVPIEVGYLSGELAEVRKGLKEGEQVVTAGKITLRDVDSGTEVLLTR